jgi:alpha,alpha-trehalase
MRKHISLFLFLFLPVFFLSAQTAVQPPDKIYGDLFVKVQMERVFPDSKTFVDCVPKKNPSEIMRDYAAEKNAADFNLKQFVADNFDVPASPTDSYHTNANEDVETHIKNLWEVLKRNPDKVVEGSSLLPLPYPYIVPGGRFREVYYWDSYFTMLGLKESGEVDMIDDMVRNFAYLIDTYGHIPNGNRSYYLGRSQPPFFSVMVELLAEIKGDSIYQTFLPAMEKEYAFWMDGAEKIRPGEIYRRVVRMKDGTVLNRYWDDVSAPRQESYREDFLTAERSERNKIDMYHQLRAAAESGIDFSSRWFADTFKIASIETTNFLPVDLNALLYHLEATIAKATLINKDDSASAVFFKKAKKRSELIDKYFWNKALNFYTDYNFRTHKLSNMIVPAGMYPFCFINEHPDYMSFLGEKVAAVLKKKLLQPGGISASAYNAGQQWDAPNGWAPLEWMTIWGLDRCGQKDLASDIAQRWIKLNIKVYKETGRLMEKYNVSDINKEAGGGEYPGQDGFGWTNGVLLHLIRLYGKPAN